MCWLNGNHKKSMVIKWIPLTPVLHNVRAMVYRSLTPECIDSIKILRLREDFNGQCYMNSLAFFHWSIYSESGQINLHFQISRMWTRCCRFFLQLLFQYSYTITKTKAVSATRLHALMKQQFFQALITLNLHQKHLKLDCLTALLWNNNLRKK